LGGVAEEERATCEPAKRGRDGHWEGNSGRWFTSVKKRAKVVKLSMRSVQEGQVVARESGNTIVRGVRDLRQSHKKQRRPVTLLESRRRKPNFSDGEMIVLYNKRVKLVQKSCVEILVASMGVGDFLVLFVNPPLRML